MATDNTATRPNFFILLELNPDAPWDATAFEKVVQAKRNEWSRQGSWVGQKALIAKQNLALIPLINSVMVDEALRKEEAKVAREIRVANRQARLDALERQLVLINAASSIGEAELNKLIEDFKDVLAPDEIRRRVKTTVQPDAAYDKTVVAQLDPTKVKKITELLQLVKKKTLYDALEMPEATATAALYRAAENLYREVSRQMPKTAAVTANTELAGLAMEMFKTEEMRQRYDASLRLGTLDSLLQDLDEVMGRSAQKRMEPEQVTLFLDSAQQAGWENNEALSKLEEYGRPRKWSVRPPGTMEPKVKCGNCGELNTQEEKNCTNCGSELYIDCPNCGQRVTSAQRACGNCGFDVGNRHIVDSQLKKAPPLIKMGRINELRNMVESLSISWKPSNPNDPRAQKIQELQKTLVRLQEEKQARQQKVTRELQNLIDKKLFYAARDLADKQGEQIVPQEELAIKKRLIADKIDEAQSLMKQVRAQSLSPDQQISKVRQVLQICADYQDAQDMLKTLPIAPPTNLQAEVRAATVRLSWDASTTADVDYTIVRKVETRPTSSKDGEVVGTIPGLYYDDPKPVIGQPLYYAVFAGFDTVASDQAAVLAEPVLLTQDVLATTVQAGNGMVKLSWETPPHAATVVIVRKTPPPPTSLSDGKQIAVNDPKQTDIIDRGLQNGQTYHYGFYCQFRDHLDRLVSSAGKVVSATPVDPPVPFQLQPSSIKNEKKDDGYEIKISWWYEGKGEVAVLRSDKALGQVKKELEEKKLHDHGHLLRGQPGTNVIVDRWDKAGAAYFTPVILLQNIAYLGTSVRYVCVDNISNIRCQNIGTAIRLHWHWPDNCQEVRLTYKTNGRPTAINDSSATTVRINRVQYENQMGGHFDLGGARDQDYYILLSAVIDDAGTKVFSDVTYITTAQRTQLELTYEIKSAGMLSSVLGIGKKRQLHLKIIKFSTEIAIPELRLVSKQGRLPFSKEDGDILKNISPLTIIAGKRDYPIDLSGNYAPDTYGKLFIEDDDWNDYIIIHHPSIEKSRLD